MTLKLRGEYVIVEAERGQDIGNIISRLSCQAEAGKGRARSIIRKAVEQEIMEE